MKKVLFNLLANWRTTAAGLASIIVAGGATLNGVPLDAGSLTAIITGVGLVFASDSRKVD